MFYFQASLSQQDLSSHSVSDQMTLVTALNSTTTTTNNYNDVFQHGHSGHPLAPPMAVFNLSQHSRPHSASHTYATCISVWCNWGESFFSFLAVNSGLINLQFNVLLLPQSYLLMKTAIKMFNLSNFISQCRSPAINRNISF